MDLQKEMMEDSSLSLPTVEELESLESLATRQLNLEEKIAEMNEQLKELNEALREVQCVAIPAVLDQIGISEFKLTNGMKVTIKEDIRASIRTDFVRQAVNWLDGHDLGGVVKNDVNVKFGRGDDELVSELMAFCEERGYAVNNKQSVHPQTLKALVKEQMARGVEFPDEYFSIFPDRKAVIKMK